MQRPEQQLINEAGTEVERYIAKLHQNLAIAEQQLSITRKLLGVSAACSVPENVQMLISKYLELKSGERYTTDKDRAELLAAEQREQLDQFAMAAIDRCILGAANACAMGKITEEEIFELSAKDAYRIAEAMQAESRKRQGGAV